MVLQECKVFEEVLSVQCPTCRLRIRMKGAGIAPAIKVSSNCYYIAATHFTTYALLCRVFLAYLSLIVSYELLCVALDVFARFILSPNTHPPTPPPPSASSPLPALECRHLFCI